MALVFNNPFKYFFLRSNDQKLFDVSEQNLQNTIFLANTKIFKICNVVSNDVNFNTFSLNYSF